MELKELIDRHGGQVILVHRHATYLMNPEGEVPQDLNLRAAQNYCRVWPDHANPLDQNGRNVSFSQGLLLASKSIPLKRILVSRQGRGPETGLYLALGFLEVAKRMPPITHSPTADYPVYADVNGTADALRTYDSQITAAWLNGLLPNLCSETHMEFLERLSDTFQGMLGGDDFDGPVLMATHFEVVKAAHALFADLRPSGRFGAWVPQKSAGVAICASVPATEGYEYDADFNIVER